MTATLFRFLGGLVTALLLGLGSGPDVPPPEKRCPVDTPSVVIPLKIRAMMPPSMSAARIVVVDGKEPLRFFSVPRQHGARLPAICGADVNM